MEPLIIPEETLESLRVRRAELRESMAAVEHALAAPTAAGPPSWAQRVHVALVELAGDLRQHVAITEAPDGLHADIVRAVPRMAHAVQQLGQDHVALRQLVDQALACAERGGPPEQIRELGIELLGRLSRHRQRGSDLVYEAFQADLGGET